MSWRRNHRPPACRMNNVYSRLEDALDALRDDKQSPLQVSVTKEVYDLFDSLEHLDLARVEERKGEPGGSDGSVYLQVVRRWCDHALNASTGRWTASSWYLGWCQADAAALHAMCGTVRAVYKGEPGRKGEPAAAGKQSSVDPVVVAMNTIAEAHREPLGGASTSKEKEDNK